jgi:autotransporter translocation and assembly factor TamB
MKFIGKLLITILIALLIAIVALYFLVQTRWGAAQVSSWITENTDYELNFDLMDHRFSSLLRCTGGGCLPSAVESTLFVILRF